VIDVALTTMTLVAAAPPNVSVAPLTKLVPVIVTLVPPLAGPELGDTLATVGTKAGLMANVNDSFAAGLSKLSAVLDAFRAQTVTL
jgi:hypothetical protein